MPVTTTDKDRTLTITASPTLTWDGSVPTKATMSYSQGASDPNMPGVVNPANGRINLRALPPASGYTTNVDITIMLDTTTAKDPNGNPIAVRWALAGEGNGAIWFCATPQPGKQKDTTPISVDLMTLTRTSDTQLDIDDNQALGGSDYTFCMGLTVPSISTTPLLIDPIVTGKGTNTSFMLSE